MILELWEALLVVFFSFVQCAYSCKNQPYVIKEIGDKWGPEGGFFSGDVGLIRGGAGTLAGTSLSTASLSSTQHQYYTNLQYSSEDHFSILYGHRGGSGSTAAAINAGVGETEAIYKSYASYLLRSDDINDGFKINSTSFKLTFCCNHSIF